MALGGNDARGSITANSGSSTAPAAGSTLILNTLGQGAGAAQVEGTFVGTLILEGTVSGSAAGWVAITMTNMAGVAVTTITAPGIVVFDASRFSQVRARSTAWTSGTAVLTMIAGPGSGGGSGGGGGGGGGSVTLADGADFTQGTTTDAGITTNVAGTVIGFLRGTIIQWAAFLARLPAALVGGRLDVNVGATGVTQPVSGTVTANAGTGTFAVSAASLPLPATAATDRATAAAPGSVELSDGAAFYTAAKTGQFPAALVGSRLDVNLGASPAFLSAGGSAPAAPTCVFTRGANVTAYTIGDEVGTASTAPTTVSVARVNGGSGVILGAQAVYSNYPAVVPQLVLLVFSATVTLAGDNAQLALSDADGAKLLAIIPLTATQALNYSAGAAVSSGALYLSGAPSRPAPHFVCGGSEQTLYCCLITLNAFTPIANSETITVMLDVEQN